MYYHQGKQIGLFDQAYEYIYKDRVLTRSLLETYLATVEKPDLEWLVLSSALSGLPAASKQGLIEKALDLVADTWLLHSPELYAELGRETLGPIEFEDWEAEE